METTTKSDLKEFRSETKRWLEENCPARMRTPPKEFADLYWGGRNSTFSSEDQKNWFTKMLEKKWIVPYWDKKCGEFFYNSIELEKTFDTFIKNLDTYEPISGNVVHMVRIIV